MGIFSIILIVAGLCLFETITSVDNAIINAEVLSTMRGWARKWFLLWGPLSPSYNFMAGVNDSHHSNVTVVDL